MNFVPLFLACGGGGSAQDAGSDVTSADVVSDVADAAVVHPADASPQVIVTDQSPNDGGLLVFEAPLTDASVPLFKITTITPNVAASPNVVREPEHRDVVPAAGEVESSSGRPS